MMPERQPGRQEVRTGPAWWVDEHGDYLFRFALSRVRHPEAAEDLVQETFLAALRSRQRFAGASSERTWLVAILKRKLVDHLRRKGRERPATDLAAGDGWAEGLFDARGRWRKKPGDWGARPDAACEREELWAVFAACLRKLPQRLAAAFTLREVDGLDGPAVCKALDVTAGNLWVMLHRARLRLWHCLGANWFGAEE